MTDRDSSLAEQGAFSPRALLAAVIAWLVPGAGHLYLGRRGRAAVFLGVVLVAVVIGLALNGNLYRVLPNQPLTVLGTLASMGMGVLYFVLRWMVGYEGEIVAAGYEYGTAFLLTAGLMNWLLVLDCWDIATGRKS
jgi:hypothetical protein